MSDKIDQLIQRAQHGDKAAFGELVLRYQKHIFTIVYGIIGNKEEAEDITQDIFIRAYRSLSSLKEQGAFYQWLLRIATNASINYKKRMNKRTIMPFHVVAELIDLGETPEGYLERKENVKQIVRALSQLSEEHRAVLVLREIQGLSYEEIARIVNRPLGTIKSRLNHARDKLRHAIREEKE